ncbi:hypothetical protein [Streptomyces sp. SPB162]|uniref:hypothetical protein n=1 Tax=Streptomyces sp. SPB162 TaxID=2940560 RepID=UPI002406DC66|nr:hypothetical protein [Streptomyces sp. SPB162]MDF9812969.1 hypothetical protein [Streptomyces sp. SPB162]
MHVGLCDGFGVVVGGGGVEVVGAVGGRVVGEADRGGFLDPDGDADGGPEGVPEVLAVVAGAERVGRALARCGVGLDAVTRGTESAAGARVGPVSASGPFAKVPDASAAAVQPIRTSATPTPVSNRFPPRRRALRGARRRAARPAVASGSGGAAGVPVTGAGSAGEASWSTGVPHPGHDRAPLRWRRHE